MLDTSLLFYIIPKSMEKDKSLLEDVTRYSALLDLYGSLLTEKNRKALALYLNEDWSLREIADYYKISRQAVHDRIQTGYDHLDDLEEKLGLEKTGRQARELLDLADEALAEDDMEKVGLALNKLHELF